MPLHDWSDDRGWAGDGILLRLIDPKTNEPYLTSMEQLQHAEEEKQRADTLAAQLARLKALMEKKAGQ